MTFRSMRESVARTTLSLRRAPGFVAIATLSLGAALGLSTSVFALIDAMAHPNSPFEHIEQLYSVTVYGKVKTQPSPLEVRAGLTALPGVESMASATWTRADVEAGETITNTIVCHTSPNFFDVLRVRPRLGRLPAPSDMHMERVALVSDNFWKLKYGNRASIDGAQISIDGHPYSIIGVLPPRAEAPRDLDIWIPQAEPDAGMFNTPIVRLKPGVSESDLQSAFKPLMQHFDAMYGGRLGDRAFRAQAYSLRPDPLKLTDVHRAMIGAALCVLLIACANVAALMLARGTVRRRDYALRLALGASSSDIAREVILEVSALAVTGSIAGAVMATWAVGLMTRATPAEMTWMGFVAPQWSVRVLAASALAVIVAVALAGAVPAWKASRTDPAGTLKESAGGTTSRAGTRFRWLVVSELALAMTLMVGASLMLKSAVLMSRYTFGFDANRLFRTQLWANTRAQKRTGSQVAELYQ
ncbi:MAG: ABC transporter permease, partial [Gemmatimonadales bacterium]